MGFKVYDLGCKSCGHVQKDALLDTAEPLPACEKCSGETVTLMPGPAFKFMVAGQMGKTSDGLSWGVKEVGHLDRKTGRFTKERG